MRPVVSWIPEETAGGDTWINKGEYATGFSVKVTSTKPGTVYVVPAGTAQDKAQIEQAVVASSVVEAGEAAVIVFPSEDPGLSDGESYILYAVDGNEGVSLPSVNVFTVDLEAPGLSQADIQEAGWSAGADMVQPRYGGASAVLLNGDILVVDGRKGKSGERYDVKRKKWSAIQEMSELRYGSAAALLPDGRVMVVGGDPEGNPNKFQKTTEIYDPESDAWESGEPMAVERFKPVAVSLADGRVLVAGGMSKKAYLKSAEIYDPETGEWTEAADMNMAREGAAAAVLTDGRVLVVGGANDGYLDTAELYDPDENEWTSVSSLPNETYKPFAVTLEDGKVMVAGGLRLNVALLYDPDQDTWEETTSLPAPLFEMVGGLLPDGRVMLAGGILGSSDSSASFLYTPQLRAKIPFHEQVTLLVDPEDLMDMLSYSIDGGSYQSLREADHLTFSASKLKLVLDILPKGTRIQFKLSEGAVMDAAGNRNEEWISDSYSYIP